MHGLFITFEGTEACGKSTQVAELAQRLRALGKVVHTLREPGGTPIGEEIRHTLKHSPANHAMTAEAELLLLNASRAQLVREVIRPALARGEIVLCDRFYDSTVAYQGYGRQLDLPLIHSILEVAVGPTHPHLTLWLKVSPQISARRLQARQAATPGLRDRFEEADHHFFERVASGYEAIAAAHPGRVRPIDATGPIESIAEQIWACVSPLLAA